MTGTNPIPAGAFYSPLMPGSPTNKNPANAPEPGTPEFFRDFKLRGVLRGDTVDAMDTSPEAQGRSNFLNIYRSKGGKLGYASTSDDVMPDDLAILLEHVKSQLKRLGQEILAGEIAVAPTELHGKRPCTWCDFRAVCRLEFPFNDVNVLEAMKKPIALQKLRPAPGQAEPTQIQRK